MENIIDEGAYVDHVELIPNSNVRIFREAYVKNCVLMDNVLVRNFCRIEDCVLNSYVQLQRNAMMYSVEIGDCTYTGKNFTAWHCKIGKYCSISWNVSIGGANHDYNRITTHAFLYTDLFGIHSLESGKNYDRFALPCSVGNDVWISCHAVICRGVSIGDGAVVAAGAVVTKDVEPYTIVAGVPARLIGRRCSKEQATRLQRSQWWNLPREVIERNLGLFSQIISDESVDGISRLAYFYERDHK